MRSWPRVCSQDAPWGYYILLTGYRMKLGAWFLLLVIFIALSNKYGEGNVKIP